MKPTEVFLGQPIRSLQTMLRVLAENDDQFKILIPDGIYGPDTMEAVRVFQKQHRLPITGVTDQLTWDTLAEAYQLALVEVAPPEVLQVLLNPGQSFQSGEKSPIIAFAQVILASISDTFHCLPAPDITGILDVPTKNCLEIFQQMNGIPITGKLDRHTWRHLALQFPTASNLPAQRRAICK